MTTSLRKGCIGLAILLGYFLLVSLPCPDGLSPNGKRAIAMMFAAVLIWVFEILPVAVASVLFAVLPAVAGILPLPKMMQLFATLTIFFVFAMFCIAIAFQNSGLSRRIVLWTSLRSKGSPVRLLLLLMMVCALLSTILADIPVVAMMLPVAVLLLEKNGCVKGTSNFGKAVMLGLSIACLIGGVGTPAGSAMNMLTISLLQSTADVHIGFFEWTAIGMPMVLVLTPLAWWLVIRAFPPEIGRLAGIGSRRAGIRRTRRAWAEGKRVHRRAGRELHPLEHGKAARHPAARGGGHRLRDLLAPDRRTAHMGTGQGPNRIGTASC